MVSWLLLGLAQAASLSGQVLAFPEGEPLERVIVVAWDLRLNYQYDYTDSEGRYLIDELDPGSWRVQALTADSMNRVSRFYPDERGYCDGALLTLADGEAREGVDLALVAGGTLTGRLLDSAGAPIAAATVTAVGVDDAVDGLDREALTDALGAFTLTGLDADPDGSSAWITEVEAEGWPDQLLGPTYDEDDAAVFFVGLGETEDLGDQPLLDGILVRGAVTGPDGPVADANVHVYATRQVVNVKSADDGTYEATGLPPGEVLSWASADGLATTYYPDVDRPTEYEDAPEEGDELAGLDLTLPRESIFNARLVPAEEGQDLSGVTALLYNDTLTVGAGTRADEDGTFSIKALYGGDYTLYLFSADEGYSDDFVRDDAGEPIVFTVDPETDNPVVEVPLTLAALMRGHLSDDAGAPVVGGYVLAWPLDGQDDGPTVAVSDADGAYELNGLGAGRYQVQARYSTYCDGDPSFVTVWWPDDEVYEALAGSLNVAAEERVEDLDFAMPVDGDQDGMADAWERTYGLDPSRDDGGEDADEDGYSNLMEYLLGTDPTDRGDAPDSGGRCGGGCGGKSAGLLMILGLGLRRRRCGDAPS